MFQRPLSTFKAISIWDILVCCDKGKCHFGIILFSGMFNLIFVINHVLKNNLSRFLSQAWEIALEGDKCLQSISIRFMHNVWELAGILQMYAFIPCESGSIIFCWNFAMRMTPTRIRSQAIPPKCSARSCDLHISSYLLFSLTDCVVLGISSEVHFGNDKWWWLG